MSVYLYDEAITDDVRRIFRDGRITMVPPEEAFNVISLLEDDSIKFPMITLNRVGWSVSNEKSQPAMFEGFPIRIDEDRPDKVIRLQSMLIRINYQVDIWTTTRLENDDITRELVWYYSLHPTLAVKIPYGIDATHTFNLYIEPDVTDNSDIVEHKSRGRYFRQTLSFYTDDAHLFKSLNRVPTTLPDSNVDVKVKLEIV